MRRVAFSMTIDPDGAMHDWVDLPEGWSLTRVPTQEAVQLLGPDTYKQLLVDLCERERPDLLVTHPPYDWLDPSAAERIRAAGTRLCGYAFDDEIFAADYSDGVRADLARIYDSYVTTRQVRWATRPLPPLPPSLPSGPPEYDVALVGRAYPRRQALVDALRAAGLRVETRGLGWPEGWIDRAAMLNLYSRSAVVLTTADWESRAVPMVKHRLLDTAMLGVFQIAQEAPDLRSYFSDEEVPSFADAAELVARVQAALPDSDGRQRRAAAARKRALDEHSWSHRFAELLTGLSLDEPRAVTTRSHFFDGVLVSLASRAESAGRIPAAAALWREAADRDQNNQAVAAGLGRCLRDLGRLDEAVVWLQRAAALPEPTCAGAVHAQLPSFGVGTGLGRLGLLPPAAEPTLLMIATLVELDRIDEAARALDHLAGRDKALLHAVTGALTFGDRPALQPLRDALARLAATML